MPCKLLFSTPIWSFELPDKLSTHDLTAEILKLRSQDLQGLQITNQGGWHSGTNLLNHPPLSELFKWTAECCTSAFSELGWDFSLSKPTFNNAWAIVNGPGHSIRAHLHPNSLFSGVIYLQAKPESGSIAFLDPRSGAQALMPPLRDSELNIMGGRFELEPIPGQLHLFPAWLWHEVGANRTNDERVCISFNVGMAAL